MDSLICLNTGQVAIVDEADFLLVSGFKWRAMVRRNVTYAVRGSGGSFMHRLVMGVLGVRGVEVDHANRNGLDNRRCNLRLCTPSQNQQNKIGRALGGRFKGIYFDAWHRQWRAEIRRPNSSGHGRGRRVFLGYFRTPEEAALAYDVAARDFFGSFARLNFPIQHCDLVSEPAA